MKLRMTVVFEEDVDPETLKQYYEAHTIQQAALNQERWFRDGSCNLEEFLMNIEHYSIHVEGIE